MANKLTLYGWYNPNRGDNKITSDPEWQGNPGDERGDYRLVRIEGQVLEGNADGLVLPGTVALISWFHPDTHDTFTTTDPNGRSGYVQVRVEGYVFEKPVTGTTPLYAWHSRERNDHLVTTHPEWVGSPGDEHSSGYEFVRIEGYIFPPSDHHVDIEPFGYAAQRTEGPVNVLVVIADLADHLVELDDVYYDQLIFGKDRRSQEGTIPLTRWVSPGRGDHFTTSDPEWSGTQPAWPKRREDYRFTRVEGFIFPPDEEPPEGTVPLDLWWNDEKKDHFSTTNIHSPFLPLGYRRLRTLGFIYDPTFRRPPDGTLPLHNWGNTERQDFFTTTHPGWHGNPGDERSPGYIYRRLEGYVQSQPSPETVALVGWYSPGREDNLIATGIHGGVDTRSPDYYFDHLEGRVFHPGRPRPAGTVPLFNWWHANKQDNFLTTDHEWGGELGTQRRGYRLFRLEGYVFDPEQPQPEGTLRLIRWTHPVEGKHITSCDPRFSSRRPPEIGYEYDRLEGFVLPPQTVEWSVAEMYQIESGQRVRFEKVGLVRRQLSFTGKDLEEMDRERDAEALDWTATRDGLLSVDEPTLARLGFRHDRITRDELKVVIVLPTYTPKRAGGQRRPGPLVHIGERVVEAEIVSCNEWGDVNLFAHELLHSVGFGFHIYGPGASLNSRGSFMAASHSAPGPGPIRLDPWHRMRAGWLRPVVYRITDPNGWAKLNSGETLLFYDPRRGRREFFFIELRGPGRGGGPRWFDSGGLGPGVSIWYIHLRQDGLPAAFTWPPPFEHHIEGANMYANYLVAPNRKYGEGPFWTQEDEVGALYWGDGRDRGGPVFLNTSRPVDKWIAPGSVRPLLSAAGC